MNKNVVADTSFYLCYECDIGKRTWLIDFLDMYSFFVGNNILSELPDNLIECDRVNRKIQFCELDFFEIVKPFYSRNSSHRTDGEYEAIGIAYHLNLHYNLKYLVIDDKIAYKFVKSNFESLAPKLTRTLGFILNCYLNGDISKERSLEILNEIKQNVEQTICDSSNKRPCSMDITSYEKILIPLIKQINE
jgi:predicted nucleic acid-binding protein